MGRKVVLTGQTFNRLTVIEEDGRTPTGQVMWLCRCSCGTEKTIRSFDITSGQIQSCGCLRREVIAKQFSKHGKSGTRVYASWLHIINRCTNSKNKDFHHYGGRGIQVCERWRNSFTAFFMDVGEPPTPKHTIDRINVNGDYEPSNCRWITQKEQTRNMRRNHILTWKDKTQCISAWVEELDVPKSVFYDRIKRGDSVESIFQAIENNTTYQRKNRVTKERKAASAQVDALVTQLGWSTDQARSYFQRHYKVSGRGQLCLRQMYQLIEQLNQLMAPKG